MLNNNMDNNIDETNVMLNNNIDINEIYLGCIILVNNGRKTNDD